VVRLRDQLNWFESSAQNSITATRTPDPA